MVGLPVHAGGQHRGRLVRRLVAMGPSLPLEDLASLPVELSVDGEVVERGTGAAAGGHPAAGLVWLAERFAESERALRARSPGHHRRPDRAAPA